jgi:hypothetical protein
LITFLSHLNWPEIWGIYVPKKSYVLLVALIFKDAHWQSTKHFMVKVHLVCAGINVFPVSEGGLSLYHESSKPTFGCI